VTTVLLQGLHKARKRAGLTQVELGEKASLSPESICRFEKLRRAASLKAADRLAQTLGVSVNKLLEGTPVRIDAPVFEKLNRPQALPAQLGRSPALQPVGGNLIKARGTRTCTDCGESKPLDSEHFQRIAGHGGYYGRCKACRNRRKRERYYSTAEIRGAEIARAWRNKLKRTGRKLY
jgi:transcriptional regulator with XRE-family HTH domain